MINPVFKNMVVETTRKEVMPLTKDNKLTEQDLNNLTAQKDQYQETTQSTISFLLNYFGKIAPLDGDASSISLDDIKIVEEQGLNLQA